MGSPFLTLTRSLVLRRSMCVVSVSKRAFVLVGSPDLGSSSITFDACTVAGASRIPLVSSAVRALRCIFTMFTPSIRTRPVLRKTRNTLPSLPLSSPRITRTVSPFDTFSFSRFEFSAWRACSRLPAVFLYFSLLTLQNLRRQRDDLHVLLLAELTRHGTEDA